MIFKRMAPKGTQQYPITSSMSSLRVALIRLGMLLTILLVPVWFRFSGAPTAFSFNYVTGSLIFFPVLLTCTLWVATGFPHWRRLNRGRALWGLALLILAIWNFASSSWAFMRTAYPGLANNATLELGLAAIFTLSAATTGPAPKLVFITLSIGLVIYGVWGGLQVARQSDLGLQRLGEFQLNPQQRGVNVVQTGDVRWLRPYGPTPHPNVFAGYIAAGVLAAGRFILSQNRWSRWIAMLVALGGLWILFLTFSRSAWLGFGVSTIMIAFFCRKTIFQNRAIRRQIILTAAAAMMLAGLFFVLYRPLILVRGGTSNEQTEQISTGERIILTEAAFTAIQRNPLLGVGAGNFPWYASYYFYFETDIEHRGDNVHNVLLTIQSEIGLVGTILFGMIVIGAFWMLRHNADVDQRFMASIFVALLVIGQFDHYPWTLFAYKVFWLALLGFALQQTKPPLETEVVKMNL
jgi:hypothetical protein